MKLKGLITSRKFWAALIGLVMVIIKAFRPDFPVDEGQLTSVVFLIVAYILGVAIEDGGRGAGTVMVTKSAPGSAPADTMPLVTDYGAAAAYADPNEIPMSQAIETIHKIAGRRK